MIVIFLFLLSFYIAGMIVGVKYGEEIKEDIARWFS